VGVYIPSPFVWRVGVCALFVWVLGHTIGKSHVRCRRRPSLAEYRSTRSCKNSRMSKLITTPLTPRATPHTACSRVGAGWV